MESIELQVPESIQSLVSDEQERLLRSALRVAAKQRSRELAKERREALTHIRRYERKYGVSFAEFERKKMRALDTIQAHEDYNDWFFWVKIVARTDKTLASLRKMESVT